MWKIAIVDDDYNVLAGLKNAIPWAELDAEWVGEAADGEQGLQLLRACQPDIVITDIYMPVLNGLDMVERLANEEYSGKIIILSGYSEFEYARQALRLGISDYLSKPVTVHTIRSVLQRTIAELEEELMQKHRHENLLDKLRVYEPFIEREWIKSVAVGTARTATLPGGGGENIKHRQAVDFIIQYIHDHYAEPITITELADRLYISRNYLSHLFKLAAGESFNSYLTRVRMEKAKKLILEGKHLIYEVAEQVGYKNVPYFSTLFKKYNGYNPTELLKQ